MDKDYIIFQEYKLYSEQKENFINRNFQTNKFYMTAVVVLVFALIFTSNVIFLDRISATLIFAFFGVAVSTLWWMNVDSYNVLIKIKYAEVIEKFEEKLPLKPFTDEYKGIENYRKNKTFLFSDIQKFFATFALIFFFAVCISELAPICASIIDKIIKIKGGI